MMLHQIETALRTTKATCLFQELYGDTPLEKVIQRYQHIAAQFVNNFGEAEFELFSAPGRTEISGNHTDHNHGKVLAGSIQMDCIAAAGRNGTNTIQIISEPYPPIVISLDKPFTSNGTCSTEQLVLGLLEGFQKSGHLIGGFNAYITSTVISAAGVSSSAAFEMLICTILNSLFLGGHLTPADWAKIGQYAENHYWNKQSGLLDQMACAVGGIIAIDFEHPAQPVVENVDFSFDQIGYDLVIVRTGGDHAHLSGEYSAVAQEMHQAAAFFGKKVLREVPYESFLSQLSAVRTATGDRAVLRALHFYTENRRVELELEALKEKDYSRFLNLITQSGNSSWKWLQNCAVSGSCEDQPVAAALALTELFLSSVNDGACRVHGGGFAGVIMAVLPKAHTADYIRFIETHLGAGCAFPMGVRKLGAVRLPL